MKRLFILILSLGILFSICVIPAHAESEITVQIYNNTDTSSHAVYSTTVGNKAYIVGSIEVGDTIYFSRVFCIGTYLWGEVYSINYDSTLAGNFVLLGSYKYTYMGETTVISDSDVDTDSVIDSDVSGNADSESVTDSDSIFSYSQSVGLLYLIAGILVFFTIVVLCYLGYKFFNMFF